MFLGAATLIGALGTAVSGISGIINNRRSQQEADKEAARQEAFYRAEAAQNPLSRSDVQYVLGELDRRAQKATDTAKATAAITGATPEYTLAVQKQNAEARGNAMAQIASNASARADRYNLMAEYARHRKAQEDNQRRLARNQTYANLAANAASAVGSIMDAYGAGGFKSAKAPKAPAAAPAAKAPDAGGNQRQLQQPPVGVFGTQEHAGRQYTMQPDGSFLGPDGLKYMRKYSLEGGVSFSPMFN